MSAKNTQTDDRELKVESLVLDDGRHAERHTSLDANGNEVVEIFAEEKRPLKLEKRIVREMKNIVAKEIHQVVKDGEVSYEEIHSLEPEVPLQLRSRLGVADHAKVVDGDYVRKDEIGKIVEDGVVAGVSALLEQLGPVTAQSKGLNSSKVLNAQEVVEKNVEEKKKNDKLINTIMVAVILGQLLFFLGYMFFM